MVDVAPFRALRFQPARKSKDVSRFICPPYDVISEVDREQLKKRSAHNVVRVELADGVGEEKYRIASKHLERWKAEGALEQDRLRSVYLLETTYRIRDPFAPNKFRKRFGVLAALRLETPGRGAVKPHERTLPKAKEDRLNLLKAVRTNVSPIFGLFFDPRMKWTQWVKKATQKPALVQGRESRDLSHRMWKVDSPALVGELRRLLKPKALYIADGHHRYEVAWAYREHRLLQEPSASMNEGWHRVMTYVCPMEESGLLMLPTHRLVNSKRSHADWMRRIGACFNTKKVPSVEIMIKTLAGPKLKQRTLGWVTGEGCFLLELKSDVHLSRCMPERHPALRDLDVVLLHDLIIGDEKEIIYTRDVREIKSKLKKGRSWSAFILSSPGVDAMAKVAESGNVMPPKTTYFYPKVPTGFTLMPLEQDLP